MTSSRYRRRRSNPGLSSAYSSRSISKAFAFDADIDVFSDQQIDWALATRFQADRDFVVAFPGTDQLLANLKTFVPGLRKIQMLPGCGHWTQQERPNEVSAALVDFIRTLPSGG